MVLDLNLQRKTFMENTICDYINGIYVLNQSSIYKTLPIKQTIIRIETKQKEATSL